MIETFLKQHGDYSGDKSFRDLTTVHLGGPVRHLVYPYTREDLREIVSFLRARHIPFKVIGNGSNLICGESAFEGVIIHLKHFNSFEIENDEVYAEAGVPAPYLAMTLAKEGLSGFEFASAIPGNIGGLVYMNAGAYRGEMSFILKEVEVLRNGEFVTLSREECRFSYRHSIFQEHPHWVVVSCRIALERKDPEEILSLMAERLERRKATQPLDKPSAGSCFRNPEGNFAWKLIEGIGYRGKTVNGIKVSEKHPNFIVNDDHGRAEDYLSVAYDIIDKVREQYGIDLIMEVEKFNC
ncbi:MAG: UDP-N-acetylmuramate dehydrogenase [Erysipelotrichaceae bacterium]|nr:UDP-N-acetylmuramate dehydrogenase [Erysipelotrichaceae bacterium]